MSLFRRSPETGLAGLPKEETEKRTPEERKYDNEREQERKEKALTHLIETGRAASRQEAEEYLRRSLRLKEKLAHFMKHRLTSKTPGLAIEYGDEGDWDNADARDKAAQENIEEGKIDYSDPTLWKTKRVIEPDGVGVQDALVVTFANGPQAEIIPSFIDGGMTAVTQLRKNFTEDDIEFIKRDYTFALKDLERKLRDTADSVASHDALGWKALAPEKEAG